MIQKHSLTLTRWHKVVERLRDEIKRQEAEVETLEEQTYFDSKLSSKVLKERILKAGMKQHSTIDSAMELMAVVTQIRTEVAKQNAKLGITERLNKVEQLNKEVAMLQKVIDRNAQKTLSADDLDELKPGTESSNHLFIARTSVKALSAEQEQSMSERVQELRRKSHGLTDEIADINRSIVSIELPDNAAAVAGIQTH